jgi:Secretion system C-terminal sorting domain
MLKSHVLLFTISLLFVEKMAAQIGCPDPQATNFNALATQNDGSCVYPPTTATPTKVGNLSAKITESSGLILAGGKYWTQNDSDNIPSIFSIDTLTGNILQTIHLEGVTHIDWEEMTTDGVRIFIGDFGNNVAGNRADLTIYAFDLSDIKPTGDDTLSASDIQKTVFAYPDQTDFSAQPGNSTAFDCEAFFWKNGQLHLFTKDWKSKLTAHYSLDFSTGFCEKMETFPFASGLITGASLSSDGQRIALLGYDLANFTCFSWLLWDFPDDQHFFSGNKRQISLGSVATFGQTEGISFSNANLATGFISNEQISQGPFLIPASLWWFDFSSFFQNLSSATGDFLENKLEIFPNPVSQVIHFQGVTFENGWNVRIFDSGGNFIFYRKIIENQLDVRDLSAGTYFLEIEVSEEKKLLKKIIKI